MTNTELKAVLERHRHWLKRDCDGWEGMCAYLSNADLRGADLIGADLRGAYLRGADLSGAHMRYAGLSNAYLIGADLSGADLSNADLSNAYLRNVYLIGADLSNACLSGAYLSNADLRNAYLRGATVDKDALDIVLPISCPTEGSFIGWKKCRDNLIVKLQIPDESKRISSTGRQCRCSSAKVLAIENLDGTPASSDKAYSFHDESFEYSIGEVASVSNFNDDRRDEYGEGINFFITRQEAVNHD